MAAGIGSDVPVWQRSPVAKVPGKQRKTAGDAQKTILGERVRLARERMGIGVRELARRIGMSASEVSRIENGEKKRTDWATIDKIAAALHAPLDHFAIAARADDYERKAHPRVRDAVAFARSTGVPEWAIDAVILGDWPDGWQTLEFYRAMQLAMSAGRPESTVRAKRAPKLPSTSPPKAGAV